MEREISWEEKRDAQMSSDESRTLILRNLPSGLPNRPETRSKSKGNLFSDEKIPFDESRLQNDFTVNFEMVSGEVCFLEKGETLDEKINELLVKLEAQSVCFWNTEPVKSLSLRQETDPAKADIGITGADFAVADTGTLVLLSAPEKPRLASLLPPVHIAILKKENIVPDLHSLFSKLGKNYGNYDELCSCVSFITGPSRTADIELSLTLGVHGPGKAIVLIL